MRLSGGRWSEGQYRVIMDDLLVGGRGGVVSSFGVEVGVASSVRGARQEMDQAWPLPATELDRTC